MSRIGKKPVSVPDAVAVTIEKGTVKVKGPKGELTFDPPASISVKYDDDSKSVVVSRPNDQRANRALHGLTRALINNMVAGVQTPFEKKLEIQGVGYNAQLNGQKLRLQVGFANTVTLDVPAGVDCQLSDPTHITITSPDKHKCGQFAANIRAVRPPEPYKGKGIRYLGENVRRKAGKTAGG
ncbi:50S ribosomal protein L6 [Stratiformator vulcanicus]|uniref:Large ribosomal subunit protein uL6 n=1 Tax=Stratiformator vulcanicus TaxID=2527980 RepID=A0A517R0Z5_9PLAN|nr:50S ribosomal protein L6 [Stratiformator vulcanicus]QDT37510.1 50S ribosomal protein L6 [Stratiformator vulcanicus]